MKYFLGYSKANWSTMLKLGKNRSSSGNFILFIEGPKQHNSEDMNLIIGGKTDRESLKHVFSFKNSRFKSLLGDSSKCSLWKIYHYHNNFEHSTFSLIFFFFLLFSLNIAYEVMSSCQQCFKTSFRSKSVTCYINLLILSDSLAVLPEPDQNMNK